MSDAGKTDDPLVGTRIAGGRYEIVRLLGEGGMGSVYQARQVAMDRLVALKLIHSAISRDEQAVKRFHREMTVTAKIEHPHTIRVYDFGRVDDAGETGGQLFLAMEFLDGRTLGKVLTTDGPMPPERLVAIGVQVAKALGAAHAEGIIHRDLKPDNVMLLDRYEHDFVKVLDFGIARSLTSDDDGDKGAPLTSTGAIIGTPAYMSPEQSLGQVLDARSDLYSLGVLLYQMASGALPFNGPSMTAMLVAHVSEPPPPILEKVPSLPPPLAQLIMDLLAKSPAARPASAAEVIARLEASVKKFTSSTMTAQVPGPQVAVASRLPTVLLATVAILVVAGAAGTMIGIGAKRASAVAAARARIDKLEHAAGDPSAPVNCQTKDPATLATLESVRNDGASHWNASQAGVALATLGTNNAPSAEWHALAARAQLSAGSLDEAILAADKALDLCPAYALAADIKGNALQKQSKLDAAKSAYEAALKSAPDYVAPRFNLGLVELRRNNPAAALAAFDEIIRHQPDHPDVFLVRAQAQLQSAHVPEAISDAEEATHRKPDSAPAWMLLAQLRAQIGKPDDARARAAAREAFCRAKALGVADAAAGCP